LLDYFDDFEYTMIHKQPHCKTKEDDEEDVHFGCISYGAHFGFLFLGTLKPKTIFDDKNNLVETKWNFYLYFILTCKLSVQVEGRIVIKILYKKIRSVCL